MQGFFDCDWSFFPGFWRNDSVSVHQITIMRFEWCEAVGQEESSAGGLLEACGGCSDDRRATPGWKVMVTIERLWAGRPDRVLQLFFPLLPPAGGGGPGLFRGR
jgi:hypothetical protein